MYCLNSGLAAKLIGLNIIVFVTEIILLKATSCGNNNFSYYVYSGRVVASPDHGICKK